MNTRDFVTLTVYCAVGVASMFGATGPPASRADKGTVAVAPVLHFKADAKIGVPVAFENTSKHAIKYLMAWPDENGVSNLQFSLYKDRQLQEKILLPRPPLADKLFVRELPPGKRIVDRAQITDFYGKLAPGTYKLCARYEVHEKSWFVKDLGLTPMSFRRTIAYLEIEGPAKTVEQRPGGNVERNAPART